MNKKFRLKKGDKVKVITGKFKGQIGVIAKIITDRSHCIIEGITMTKKNKKASSPEQVSGIIDIPCSIHISNVMYFDENSDKASKISYMIDDGKKHRFLKGIDKVLNEV